LFAIFAGDWGIMVYPKAISCAAFKGRGGAVLRVLLAVACVASCRPAAGLNDVEQAERFVMALNGQDADGMVAVADVPFAYRRQEWEKNGDGFSLGAAMDRVVEDKAALRSLFGDIAKSVKIEQTTPAEKPPAREELLKEFLAGAAGQWSRSNILVFRRGLGDVEHIAIVGVSPDSKKVIAIYLN